MGSKALYESKVMSALLVWSSLGTPFLFCAFMQLE
mgnify:CR=1 FL=1